MSARLPVPAICRERFRARGNRNSRPCRHYDCRWRRHLPWNSSGAPCPVGERVDPEELASAPVAGAQVGEERVAEEFASGEVSVFGRRPGRIAEEQELPERPLRPGDPPP